MFANLKEKFNERLKTLTVPQDPLEKRINDLVERATSDVLIGPDWQTNLELVDVINTNDPSATLEKATRALNRPLHSQNTRVQLLTITALETCIKNCRRPFHQHLATSELFGSLLRIADPPPQTPVSSEVKDRVLCLVEDLAKALEGTYRNAYETLLDNGVDFPVRSPEDAVPLEIPAEVAGPSNDYSEEDRAAIARAMAEMASEEQAQQPAQQQGPPPGVPVLVNPVAAAAVASRRHPPPPTGPPQAPPAPEAPQAFAQVDAGNVVKTAKASGELLGEVLQALSGEGQQEGVKEAYVSELADQCRAQRSQLQELLESCTDEVVLADALGAHEELQRVLGQYQGLLAACQPPSAPAPHSTPQSPAGYALAPQYTLSDAAPAPPPQAAPAPHPTPAFAGAQFTLSDDDEDADEGLVTKRAAAPALPTAPVPILPPPPATSAPAPAPAADLIDLGSENGSPPKYRPPPTTTTPTTTGGLGVAAPAAPPAAAASSGDPLMDEMDRLMSTSSLNAQPTSPTAQQQQHPTG